jgi:pentatricopeptide repeat protein
MEEEICVRNGYLVGLDNAILLNGLCKSGNVGDTLKVLDRMSSPGSDVCLDIAILNTIVDGLRTIESCKRPLCSWMSG